MRVPSAFEDRHDADFKNRYLRNDGKQLRERFYAISSCSDLSKTVPLPNGEWKVSELVLLPQAAQKLLRLLDPMTKQGSASLCCLQLVCTSKRP